MVFRLSLAFVVGAVCIPAAVVAAEMPQVSLVNSEGDVTLSFSPFIESPGTIGSIAVGDLGNDGVAELLVGAGVGMPPTVAVFRQDGSPIGDFLAYDVAFTGGVNVAVCDIDGDGANEIITGARYGGGPHVRIFTAMGASLSPGFFAYDDAFRGGVHVACGDINEDGVGEIITGAGLSGGPHMKVFSEDGKMLAEVFHGSAYAATGVYVTVRDGAVLAAPMAGEDTSVTTFAFVDDALRVASTVTTITRNDLFAQALLDSTTTVTADIASDIVPHASPKYILVDISEQTLTAYVYGVPIRTFLVSTGTTAFPTPLGATKVYEKILWKDYVWSYGTDNPNNYNLPNVQYNLRIYQHIYIHYAYWHNNFGTRMSHGCVNVGYDNAQWIYHWADVDVPVEIVP